MARDFRFGLTNDADRLGSGWPEMLFGFFQEPSLVRALRRFETISSSGVSPADGEAAVPIEIARSDSRTEIEAVAAAGSANGPQGTAPAFVALVPPFSLIGGNAAGDIAPGGSMAILTFASPLGSALGAAGTVGAARGAEQILYSGGLIIDLGSRQILTGGAQDPVLGSGDSDTFVVSGSGLDPIFDILPAAVPGLETVVLAAGGRYDLVSLDDHVASGATMTINAARLGVDDWIAFDGSAERDGRFIFLGGEGGDLFVGGAGQDLIFGQGGGDVLAGGAGADRFGYVDASESSGLDFDVLFDFDPGEDSIDLPVAVTGFDAPVETGALSEASFDEDLSAVLGGLGAGRAILFTADSGDLAGVIFLIVDGNGEVGYQAGEDFVFALPNASLADLSAHSEFFI